MGTAANLKNSYSLEHNVAEVRKQTNCHTSAVLAH
jgi:hypothetical protein